MRALCQFIAHAGHLAQMLNGGFIVSGIKVHHTQRIGSRAHNGVFGGGHIGVEVSARLLRITLVVVAFAHQAMDFGGKILVHLITEQTFAQRNHTSVVFVMEIDLAHIILALVAQFAATVDVGELRVGSFVVVVGVVDIGIVEARGIAVALRALKRLVLIARVGVLLQLQIAVSHAIDDIFAVIAVECAFTHLAIGGEGIVVVAVIKFQVSDAHQHIEHQLRRRILRGKGTQFGKSAGFVALQSAKRHIIVGVFVQRSRRRQFFHTAHLMDSAHVVMVFVHEFATLKIALGIA